MNLRTLILSQLRFFELPMELLSHEILQRISIIHLEDSKFASPDALLKFLASLGKRCSCIGLHSISFSDTEWDGLSCYSFSGEAPFEWNIKTSIVTLEVYSKLIRHHRWNVVFLNLWNARIKTENISTLNITLRHIGANLKCLYLSLFEDCVHDEPTLLNLSCNTSLELLVLKNIGNFRGIEDITPFVWLTSLFETIQSRDSLKEIQAHISFQRDDSDSTEWRCIETFDWPSLENILTDTKKFPGIQPVFFLCLSQELWRDEVLNILWDRCLPKLVEKGRLRLGISSLMWPYFAACHVVQSPIHH